MGMKRRELIKGAAAGSVFTLGFVLPGKSFPGQSSPGTDEDLSDASEAFQPNAFVRIAAEGDITIILGQAEMGQNIYTTLPVIVAEELDVDPRSVNIMQSEVSQAYNSTFLPFMMTGGSSSVNTNYERLRQAGAAARSMLVSAAASQWGVDSASLTTEDAHVINPSTGERKSYGSLAGMAAGLPVPTGVTLKPPSEFRYIGKDQMRLDSELKVTGTADFAIDARPSGLHFAVVVRAPVFGAVLKSVDDSAAAAMPGVAKIKRVPSGIAVIAKTTWQARQASQALNIEWDEGGFATGNSAQLRNQYLELAGTPGFVVKKEGDAPVALEGAANVMEAIFEFPFLAHACMEPMNCTVHDLGGRATVWSGSQLQTGDRAAAAGILGYDPESVDFHTAFLGGGFGRRATIGSDVVSEATHVAKGEAWPVQTVWTREDDMRGGYYRPMYVHHSRLVLDDVGKPFAWQTRVVGQMLNGMEVFMPEGSQFGSGQVEGLIDQPYEVPNFQLEAHLVESPIPTLWWRSVGNTHTAFVKETVLDEAAHAAGMDPIDYRKALLGHHPRQIALLEKVRQTSGWGGELPPGTGLGVAVHESFGSIVAEVAQVRVDGSDITVEKVWCAVDCGYAVNPLGVREQLESAVVYGLSAALFGEITIENGRAVQGNFDDYPVVRINQSPEVEVAIINSGASMGGVGEPGTPPIFPAVGNAIFAATGKRLRTLPFRI
jgi:isoquinoline 1-oxidoreductase beta subunit